MSRSYRDSQDCLKAITVAVKQQDFFLNNFFKFQSFILIIINLSFDVINKSNIKQYRVNII